MCEKATELLHPAGWKKSGDTWTTADGKPAKYDIKYPTEFADWNPRRQQRGRPAEPQFGFKIGQARRHVFDSAGRRTVPAGKFDIAIQGWGASRHPTRTSPSPDLYTSQLPRLPPTRAARA